jgi:hypothetical protein
VRACTRACLFVCLCVCVRVGARTRTHVCLAVCVRARVCARSLEVAAERGKREAAERQLASVQQASTLSAPKYSGCRTLSIPECREYLAEDAILPYCTVTDSDYSYRYSDYSHRYSDYSYRYSDYPYRYSDYPYRSSDYAFRSTRRCCALLRGTTGYAAMPTYSRVLTGTYHRPV